MYLIGPVSGGYHLKLDPAPQPWHLTHLGPPPGIQQFHPLQALGEFGVASLPADQHSSFPILEAQHQKDPLKKLRRKFVYVFHNLHIYHLDASKLLNQFKHFLWKKSVNNDRFGKACVTACLSFQCNLCREFTAVCSAPILRSDRRRQVYREHLCNAGQSGVT